MHVSSSTLEEIERAYREYTSEVQKTGMTSKTKKTYLLHSGNFVRWIKGDFVPGTRTDNS